MKPTRDQFRAEVLAQFPGATVVDADRGLTVIVGTPEAGYTVKRMAEAGGLYCGPEAVKAESPEDYRVRVFGFPRKAADMYFPADDENLKGILTKIHQQVLRRAGELDIDQAEYIRCQRIAALADKGLRLLAGKES